MQTIKRRLLYDIMMPYRLFKSNTIIDAEIIILNLVKFSLQWECACKFFRGILVGNVLRNSDGHIIR
jgi:hypothetical protein